jgi:hypothetical protein
MWAIFHWLGARQDEDEDDDLEDFDDGYDEDDEHDAGADD